MKSENEPAAESPLVFPCAFPIKVMGQDENQFEDFVIGLIAEHSGPLPTGSVRSRGSKNGRYLAVTVTVMAESRTQLDNIYRSLTSSERVLFVL
jgi:putative lipoic acid-binding regulatory protein